MAFTKLSSDSALNQKIMLENIFIIEYMPYAPDNYTKVYLYGLSLACHNLDADNNPERIAKRLGVEVSTVNEAYQYWESQGLVNVIPTDPITIEYLTVKLSKDQYKKYSKEKYKDFNNQLHAMLPNRNILPNEYNEYYSIMESMNIEKESMLTIISYCIRLKGEDITFPYILAVARNLAHDGYTSYARVSEKLSEFDMYDKDIALVHKALKIKRTANHEDKKLMSKWKSYGFNIDTIVAVCKSVSKGGITHLDNLLTKYYENHLFSIIEIDNYRENREKLYSLTKQINKIIGVYYEQLDFIIESYISKWISLGFNDDSLTTIADHCFRNNVRTLEGMNKTVEKYYKQGLVTVDNINNFARHVLNIDKDIQAILDTCKITRNVTDRDRDNYHTWTSTWNMTNEMIQYAASQSIGKANPIAYINVILAGWFEKKIKNLEEAKACNIPNSSNTQYSNNTQPKDNIVKQKTLSNQEINSLFSNLDIKDI